MIAIGIGASSKASRRAFSEAIAQARSEAGGGDLIAAIETALFANDLRDAAGEESLTYLPVTVEAMRNRNDECVTRSERSLSLFGVASVAEAAALAGAGPGSRLIMARRAIGHITVAAARSADDGARHA